MRNIGSRICATLVVAVGLITSSALAEEVTILDEESPEYQAMVQTYRAFRELANEGDYKGARQFVRLEGYVDDPGKTWPESKWEVQAKELESRGKENLEKLSVERVVKHRGLQRGILSATVLYEGTEKSASRNVIFVFVDGKPYIVGF